MLHFDGEAWNAYTYRWREDGQDADLVPSRGDERPLRLMRNYQPGKPYPTTWRFTSRAECLRCHNTWCGTALGFNHAQLSGMFFASHFDDVNLPEFQSLEQTDVLAALGIVDTTFTQQNGPEVSPAFHTDTESLNDRARSYLHANCSHCHRKNAGGAVEMMLNLELGLPEMRVADVKPMQGGLGLNDPRLIAAGDPWRSVICVRLAKTGAGHMPVIGPGTVDVQGLALIEDWIAQMGGVASAKDLLPKQWSEALIRDKLATVEGAMQVRRAVDDGLMKYELTLVAFDVAWKSPLPTVRDLFDRFKPEELRETTIGTNPDPAKLLAMTGDAKRGAAVLSLQGKLATCYACHFIGGTGRDFGPDLSKVGARLKREQILESLLQPGKTITQGYAAVTVEMNDGTVQAGFIVKESVAEIALKTATGQTVTLRKDDVKAQTKLPASLMPEGLLQGLTAQEAADVVSHLETLR